MKLLIISVNKTTTYLLFMIWLLQLLLHVTTIPLNDCITTLLTCKYYYVLCSRVKHSMYKYSTSTLNFEVFCALLQTFHILGRFLAFLVSKFADKLMNLSKAFSIHQSKVIAIQNYLVNRDIFHGVALERIWYFNSILHE